LLILVAAFMAFFRFFSSAWCPAHPPEPQRKWAKRVVACPSIDHVELGRVGAAGGEMCMDKSSNCQVLRRER
jgi:hypothetical protein